MCATALLLGACTGQNPGSVDPVSAEGGTTQRDATPDSPVARLPEFVTPDWDVVVGPRPIDRDDFADAVFVGIDDDLAELVEKNPAGTTFWIEAGVHRLASAVPKDDSTFVGEEGAVLSGAVQASPARFEGGFWVLDGQAIQGRTNGTCEDGYGACVYPEQVFVDGSRLWQVETKAELDSGEFFFDYAADRIYLADDPTGLIVEVSSIPHAFSGAARGVTIRNLVIEKYANPAQTGVIEPRAGQAKASTGWLIEHNEVRFNHGEGIRLADEIVVRENEIHGNGRLGVQGRGGGVLVEANDVHGNCVEGFQCFGWGGGGIKFGQSTDLVVRANFVHDNHGPGIHSDTHSVGPVIENNLVIDNDGSGISIEVTYGATVRNNTVHRNGHNNPKGRGAGVIVISSNDVVVEDNEVVGNGNGILARQVEREPGESGPHVVENLLVEGNVISMDVGVTGMVDQTGDRSYFTSRANTFVGNTYYVGDHSSESFRWDDGFENLDAWRNRWDG